MPQSILKYPFEHCSRLPKVLPVTLRPSICVPTNIQVSIFKVLPTIAMLYTILNLPFVFTDVVLYYACPLGNICSPLSYIHFCLCL